MKKALVVIQCRLGSSRFKDKAMALLDGEPLIAHVVSRALKIRHVTGVVVATVPQDAQRLASVCDCTVVAFDDVPEDDVLGRFVRVAEKYLWADAFVRLTGDCVLLQPEISSRVVELYRATPGCQYGWTNTSPGGDWFDGCDTEMFSRDLLMRADALATRKDDREHVTKIMRRLVKPAALPPDPIYRDWPKLSVDDLQDLERVRNWQSAIK